MCDNKKYIIISFIARLVKGNPLTCHNTTIALEEIEALLTWVSILFKEEMNDLS